MQHHVSETVVFHFLQWFGHDSSNAVFSVDVFKFEHPFIGKVLDEAVSDIDILGSLVRHQVASHKHRIAINV